MSNIIFYAKLIARPVPWVRFSMGLLASFSLTAAAAPSALHSNESSTPRPVDGIRDNSFLVEEAYNQEPGVVQHIFSAAYGWEPLDDGDEHRFDFLVTQEWPLFSRKHQLGYTVPYGLINAGDGTEDGLDDVLLNYRYQLWYNESTLPACAPRFSPVLPTGGESGGANELGYQWNLPLSTTISDRWFFHANAGLTFLPGAGSGPGQDLLHYNLGASAIYAVSARLHLLFEWVGAWRDVPMGNGGAGREFESLVSPGARYAFNFANGAQLVLGAAAPIGVTDSAPDFGALLYVSFEHNFLKAN